MRRTYIPIQNIVENDLDLWIGGSKQKKGAGGEKNIVINISAEAIVTISIWICAIGGIIVMHRIAPEQKTYKIWAILDAVTITVLMYYNSIQ